METYTTYSWYQQLTKPSWAPPSWLFGPVWTFLYILIAISFGTIFYLIWKKKLPRKFAAPFILNIISNILFTPLQFGLRNNFLAAIDILIVLITLIWIIKSTYPKKKIRWVAFMQLPYLLWVSFATILQITITFLNR